MNKSKGVLRAVGSAKVYKYSTIPVHFIASALIFSFFIRVSVRFGRLFFISKNLKIFDILKKLCYNIIIEMRIDIMNDITERQKKFVDDNTEKLDHYFAQVKD